MCEVRFMMKLIDKQLLDDVSRQAQKSGRLRMNYNFHQSLEDKCHRFLNAVEPGTVMPIHRHKGSSETCICICGHFEEYLYGFTETRSDGTPDPNSFGIVETVDMYPGGPILNIEKGQWHSLKCLESGTILFEAKDGPYHPLEEDEILSVQP